MEIEFIIIPQNRKIILTGDPRILKEATNRNKTDKDLDIFPESIIVYPDLVFTLKYNSNKYFRPSVRYESEELFVVSNILFFRAIKEANLREIDFDLHITTSLPLEKLIEEYRLRFPDPPRRFNYIDRFLFFNRTPRTYNEYNRRVIFPEENSSREFKDVKFLRYKLQIYESPPEEVLELEHELIARLVNENGFLRSIDGLRNRCGNIGQYIK